MISTKHHNKIKEELQSILKENKYNIVSIGFGFKQKQGKFTNERSIRFGVEKKITYRYVDSTILIPPTLTIDGKEYKTDVYKAEKIVKLPTLCNPIGDMTVVPPAGVIPPVSYNRARTRPLSGGVSMAAPPPVFYVNAGTLGGIVVDKLDGKLVALTNNHVAGTPGLFFNEASTEFYIAGDTYGATSSAYKTINCYQNSSWDSGTVYNEADIIGTTKRCYPLTTGDINVVDAAIVNLDNSLLDSSSWYPLSAPFTSPVPFATTEEINNLYLNDPVFKSGRTTGPVGNGACSIRVVDSTASYPVGYETGALFFTDLLEIRSPSSDTTVGLGGDSGSLVYACVNSTNPLLSAWKCIGLFFAGTQSGNMGLACRIDNVTTLLNVSAWDGTSINANPNTPSYKTVNFEDNKFNPYIEIDGKTYWQVGKTLAIPSQ
jgi:hypothetical protein